jgi:hypothetical protein
MLKAANSAIKYGPWNVYLHKESVQVRLREGEEFSDKDMYKAIRLSQDSFNKHITKAGYDLGFRFDKDRLASIKCVRFHLGFVESGVAKNVDKHLMVKDEHGKVWFILDQSKGYEHEYTHKDTYIDDAEKVERVLNDIKENDPLNLSELTKLVRNIAGVMNVMSKENLETARGLQSVVKLIESVFKISVPQEAKVSESNGVDRKEPARYIG